MVSSPTLEVKESWRRASWLNISLLILLETILCVSLAISSSLEGSSIFTSTIIYQNSCDDTDRLNALLHFIVNLLSSAIAASSNYFMQILSSPSRDELDLAHSQLRGLDIGISSIRNIGSVSRFKSFSWLALLVASSPIHIFFNSVIFSTTYQGSKWQVTIGTEDLINGTTYYPPGASLAPAGSWMPLCTYTDNYGYACLYNTADVPSLVYSRDNTSWTFTWVKGFGEAVPLDNYWNTPSAVNEIINDVVVHAHGWRYLDPGECELHYGQGGPREQYGDVLVVVDTESYNKTGWTRREIFNFSAPNDLSRIWDPHVPPEAVNPLWYSTTCGDSILWYENDGRFTCESMFRNEPNTKTIFQYPLMNPDDADTLGYHYHPKSLVIKYCLAQPLTQCKIGISNSILSIVILSVFVKIVLCLAVAIKLPNGSLVMPGDAIKSFILRPDPTTIDMGTLDIIDLRNLEKKRAQIRVSQEQAKPYPPTRAPQENDLTLPRGPRVWRPPRTRRLSVVMTLQHWICSYLLFISALVVLGISLAVAISSNHGSLQSSFGRASRNLLAHFGQPGYFGSLILVNVPQLVLTLCYFVINSIWTQLLIELEWSSYSSEPKPLRVSNPTGQQVSGRRLQMPYRYGIPLFSISIILHWVLSNALFIYISEGGYLAGTRGPLEGVANQFGLSSEDSFIAVGYSPLAFLVLLIIASFFILLPILFGLRKLPHRDRMVIGGWNSLIISAACHVSKTTDGNRPQDDTCVQPVHEGLGSRHEEEEGVIIPLLQLAYDAKELATIAQSKIQWGAKDIPVIRESTPGDGRTYQIVRQVGFAIATDNIQMPVPGLWYI